MPKEVGRFFRLPGGCGKNLRNVVVCMACKKCENLGAFPSFLDWEVVLTTDTREFGMIVGAIMDDVDDEVTRSISVYG